MILFSWLGYLYTRKKEISLVELAGWGTFHYIIYLILGVRLSFFLSIFVLVLYVLLVKQKKNYKNGILKLISKVGFPLLALVTIVSTVEFNPVNKHFGKLNYLLSNRLSQGRIAFDKYEVTLFGQKIVMKGNSYFSTVFNGNVLSNDYFYIDSGYVYALLGYGLVFLIFVLIAYSYLYTYFWDKNMYVLWIWITVILVYSVINDCWLTFTYNPIFLILIPTIKEGRKQKIEYQNYIRR